MSLKVISNFKKQKNLSFQKCLSDATKEMPQVTVLSWSRHYDLRVDGFSLTEVSAKQYLEDMLTAVRHSLERRRVPSNSAVTNEPPTVVKPQRQPPSTPLTSTPLHSSIDEDARYMKFYKICYYSEAQ